jgi:mannose-6-phosphate isomerase-like protein (cupin superfamily)
MKPIIPVAAALLLLSAPAAFAQPMPQNLTAFAASATVQALIAKAKAERKPGQPLVSEPIVTLAPYHASLEYRPAKAPAAVHEKDLELMYVIQGTGTVLTGGTLKDAKRTNASNLSGPDIEGGKSFPFAPGAIVIVPQNTPHQVIPAPGSALVLMTFHAPLPAPVGWP